MNRIEVKTKLRWIIREMLLSDLEAEREIPGKIIKQMLGNYGCAIAEEPNEAEDLNTFTKHLQDWIENAYLLQTDPYAKETEETECDLNSVFEQYLEAETEYCEVLMELIMILEEMLKYKEKYSQYFRNKCKGQETKMQILHKKCQCLELDSLFKLFKEENALEGHLKLREKLKNELNLLKKNFRKVMEYNRSMSEIKNDKTFSELFQLYTELKKIEEKAEIIAQLQT